MELEKEPRKSTIPPQPSAKPYQTQPTKTFLPIKKNYSQEVCVVMGVAFLVLGLVGFVVDNLFGAHLSYTHNAIHVVSGALSLWFGFDSLTNAKRTCYVLGTIYGAAGILGFFLGHQGIPSLGNMAEDNYLWKIIPAVLELGTVDHILHILFGAIFLNAAALNFKRFQSI